MKDESFKINELLGLMRGHDKVILSLTGINAMEFPSEQVYDLIINSCRINKTILMFAFRYALGRESTAPSIVSEQIKENINLFNEGDIKSMIDDIEAAPHLGMECDIARWNDLKEFLYDEMVRRGLNEGIYFNEIRRRI